MPENSQPRFAHADSAWQIPVELQRYVPRPVRLSKSGKAYVALMVVMAVGAIALGVLLYTLSQRGSERSAALETRGRSVRAEVIDSGIARNQKNRAFIVYRYVAGGLEYRRRFTLPRRDRPAFAIGSAITIRYLPENPGESWPMGYGPEGPPLVVVTLMPAIMGFCLWPLSYTLQKQRRLLAIGRPAEGRVRESKRVLRGKHTAFRIEYEFKVLSGAVHSAKAEVTGKPPEPGSVATILYDPDDPGKIAVYPLCLVRIGQY